MKKILSSQKQEKSISQQEQQEEKICYFLWFKKHKSSNQFT